MNASLWAAVFIPLAGTAAGAAFVFFIRDHIPQRLEHSLLGFAAGVMISAGVFSLLLPSLEQAGWAECSAGFLSGIFFLLLLDHLIPHFHAAQNEEEGLPVSLKKTTKLFLAMSLHNIPEGMAVGIVLASAANGDLLTMASAAALALGIALQNIPEGAVLSLPLHAQGMSRKKAFLYGTLSGVVEPAGTIMMLFLADLFLPMLPFLLAFAAGAMFYVTIEELIPESQSGKHSNLSTIAFSFGFVVMMVLDLATG